MKIKSLLFLALILIGNSDPSLFAQEPPFDVVGGFCNETIFRMVDRNNGWARSTHAILKTTDGGNSWRTVLTVESEEPMGSCFYDSKTAWAVTGIVDNATNATVYRTSDGGRSWAGTGVHLSAPIMSCFLSFPEVDKGWFMLIPDHGMNSSPGELYRTDDAGQNWRKVNSAWQPSKLDLYTKEEFERRVPYLTCGGAVVLRNETDGWMCGSLASTTRGFLFMTRDGGANWQGQALALPTSLENGRMEPMGLPRFFESNGKKGILVSAFVPVDSYSTNFATVIYRTRDGGVSWQPTTPVKSSFRAFSFTTASEGWVWSEEPRMNSDSAKGKLYRTKDGGVSWMPVKAEKGLDELLQRGERIVQLDFVDSRYGWAVALDNSLHTQFFRTIDGGKMWRTVQSKFQE